MAGEDTGPVEPPPAGGTPRYRVTTVEVLTGIPASTLRSWERRYGWPRPVRTPAGQRLYSDADVAVVRFLARRRVEGMSMAQATGLLCVDAADPDPPPDQVLGCLGDALLAFDEPAAEAAFAAGERLLGVEGAVCELVPGAIARAGSDAEGSIDAEHFASNFLRRQVLRLLDRLPQGLGRPVLVACGPDEQHELGAMVLTLLLRRRGHRVVYLGARVPSAALERAARVLDPAGIAVSLTMPDSLEQAVTWARGGRGPDGQVPLWWGGQAVGQARELAGRLPGEVLAGAAGEAVATIGAALAAGQDR